MTDHEDIPADWSALIRLGIVEELDLAAARCVVRYGDPDDPDGGARTPPIRWLSTRAGRTRTWSPPSIGEQVILLAPDAQIGAAVALAGLAYAEFPPAGDDETERVVFADGACVEYDPVAHSLKAILPEDAVAEIVAPGGLTIRGDVVIEGSVTVSETLTAHEDIVAAGKSLKGHRHNGVQPGQGISGIPA